MTDIINKSNRHIAIVAVLSLIMALLLMVSLVTLAKDCYQETFTVMLIDGSDVTLCVNDLAVVNTVKLPDVAVGDTVTLWYNATDNIVIENYEWQTWGCLGLAGACAVGIAITLLMHRRKNQVKTT